MKAKLSNFSQGWTVILNNWNILAPYVLKSSGKGFENQVKMPYTPPKAEPFATSLTVSDYAIFAFFRKVISFCPFGYCLHFDHVFGLKIHMSPN